MAKTMTPSKMKHAKAEIAALKRGGASKKLLDEEKAEYGMKRGGAVKPGKKR